MNCKTILALLGAVCLLVACSSELDEPSAYATQQVTVHVEGELPTREGIEVKLTDSRGMAFVQATDTQGVATLMFLLAFIRHRCRTCRTRKRVGAPSSTGR